MEELDALDNFLEITTPILKDYGPGLTMIRIFLKNIKMNKKLFLGKVYLKTLEKLVIQEKYLWILISSLGLYLSNIPTYNSHFLLCK